jgi:putative flavoprotein involved in K+ transport
VLRVDPDLEANVARGDEVSARLKAMVDMVIAKEGLDVPPPEADPADDPFPGIEQMARVRQLDLDTAHIRSIIWATGFGPDFGYLDPALLDPSGRPRHRNGICDVPGLYCLGFTWLRRRASGLIPGVADDAESIAHHIAERQHTTK